MLKKGRVISHYEIVEEIGRGGMGVVYRARDLSLNRSVAVKALPLYRSTDALARQRFEREAQAASALNHPNIVTIYELLIDDDVSYIVMEFIDGYTLGELIPANGLPPNKALKYAAEIADALGCAHEAGIIHRDLKPQNILVSKRDHVKVLDFGVAKLQSNPSGEPGKPEELTTPGAFVGTTHYAAPEQLFGGMVDHRTDIYALGVVLYQMLSGRVPFSANNQLELLQKISYEEPRSLLHQYPHFPIICDEILSRALHKQADGRYPDMAVLAEDLDSAKEQFRIVSLVSGAEGTQTLEQHLEMPPSSSVSSFPPAPSSSVARSSYPPSPSSSRSSYPPITSGPPQAGYEKASIAVLPFRSLSADKEDEYTAMGIGSEIGSALSRVPAIRVASNLATYRYRDDAPDLIEIATKLNIRYVLNGSLRRAGTRIRVAAELSDALASTVLWARTYERHIEDLFAVQEEIAESIVRATGGELIRAGAAHADKASAHELDAWGLVRKAYHFWNYGFDVAGIAGALDLLRQAVTLDPNYANAHAFLALYLIERVVLMLTPTPDSDRAEADTAAKRAMELAPQDAEVLENVGLVWLHCHEYAKSVEALRRAVGIAPFNLVAWGYLGLALGWGGKERDAQEAVKILNKLVTDTPEHPSLPYWYFFLSGTYVRLQRYQEAVEAAQRCVELQPRFYVARITLANALGHIGKVSEARDEMAQVMAVNPYVSEGLLETEYKKISHDPQVAELHLAGLRSAHAMPAVGGQQ